MTIKTLVPNLVVHDAVAAIDFYTKALGAVEISRMPTPEGKILHAELKLGDQLIFVNDEFGQGDCKSPQTLGGTVVTFTLEVDDAVAAADQAIRAGALETMKVEKQFWGAMYGQVRDPFGHFWAFNTMGAPLSPDEIKQNLAAMS